ncbi:EcsC family protein [Bifidobacterium sp. ESL0790]|uniref:EcsC family protein n=1 Tax=Bifidobacterium sp. ESL0790 TaxID=2983233 RepID=UPI0023F7C5A8|nr:EcsC family protein [Bifidobacterium sp. ESL0790]WEV73061.1 EcsC family protein [Bifidobacterium sp. ESL0790]
MEEKDREQPREQPVVPNPILDAKECEEFEALDNRFKKLTTPGRVASVGKTLAEHVPENIKEKAETFKDSISERDIYKRAMEIASKGFHVLEEQAAKYSVNEAGVVKNLNAVLEDETVNRIDDICFMRSYDVSKAANKYSSHNVGAAVVEGASTGAMGVAGIPLSLVMSTFLEYRAVQTIAMAYGYDVKNDPDELVIAGGVFSAALNPHGSNGAGIPDSVAKFMAIAEAQSIKQTAKKGWAAMAGKGGPALMLAQIRALANAAAEKALQKVGQKGLENSVFKTIFEQVGRKMTLKVIDHAVPVVSAGFGALFDTAQMSQVLQYADIFYHKRFLTEKKDRINAIIGESGDNEVINVVVEDEDEK